MNDAKWDDPKFWESISVGYCRKCGEGHVLKHGLCWNCRPSPMPDHLMFPSQA